MILVSFSIYVHLLPDEEFIKELRRFNGTPKAVLDNPELMELLLPLLRSDIRPYETYVYDHEAPLDCPISAFGGLEDEEVSREDLAAWYDQTRSRFSLQTFPGDHFFEWETEQWPFGDYIKGYQKDNRQNEESRHRHSHLSKVDLVLLFEITVTY